MAPVAVLALLITGALSVISMVTARLPVPVALVAYTVTLLVASTVGVPEMTPVLAFNDSPAGRAVEL